MKLIVGLGNPGERYINSRHNVGFLVVEALARKLLPAGRTVWRRNKRFNVLLLRIPDKDLLLVKPQTMMNASGIALKKILDYYRFRVKPALPAGRPGMTKEAGNHLAIQPFDHLIVVHDDLDLPLGKIKIVKARGSAGHRGVESIIKELGRDDFWRLRLGIGRPAKEGEWLVGLGRRVSQRSKKEEVTDFVLSELSGKEKSEAKKMIKKAVETLFYIFEYGHEAATVRYHQ